jgi:hypothetical protein
MIRSDASGFRADGRKSVRTITTQDIRRSPERIGYHSHLEAGRPSGIERMIVVIGHAGHHQSAVRPKDGSERVDQALRPAVNRTHS